MPAAKRRRPSSSIYDVHPGVRSMQDWVAALKGKTGRSLDEWIKFTKKSGPSSEVERRDWLKKVQGLGTNAAAWIAKRWTSSRPLPTGSVSGK